MLTDRDGLTAVLTAVLALSERLTGERLTIHLRTESGDEIQISGANTSWTPVIVVDKTAQVAA